MQSGNGNVRWRFYEHELGVSHPDTATAINNLAYLYRDRGRYDEAEPLYLQALRHLKNSEPRIIDVSEGARANSTTIKHHSSSNPK